ncbi:uncharacterized protein FIBRA_03501 [Fibroporia radiculosa]|uniref:Cytochrome c oxidase subunit 6, mitochondrial n=1 Tax=Fibroporia radiculosa TaxID=599839 RepID=J4H2F8_9APHY|nr:uncharacterized protein FIBRA_03501 [Fibroporia radiculosa]CCM01449.1 predicted protein [Fibroporia radiculosa]
MRAQMITSLLRARPVARRIAPTFARASSGQVHEETFESFTERYVTFFQQAQDLFEVQRGLNNCFAHDLVPAPSVIEAAVRAARRVNDYATAVRVFEGIKEKVENKQQYQAYLDELKPVREELDERLLAAARSDNEELVLEVFEQEGTFNINFQDGLGNTALHYAASHGSTGVLEYILSHEECDVDLTNRLEGATPLHLALRLGDPEIRVLVVESLLDAGANTMIKNKHGQTALSLLGPNDTEIRTLMRKAQAEANVSRDDIADDDDDEDGSGSGSGSDED